MDLPINPKNSESDYKISPVALRIALIGFLIVIIGFFLSWGIIDYQVGEGVYDRVENKPAGIAAILLGLPGFVGFLTTLALFFTKLKPKTALWIIRIIGILGFFFFAFSLWGFYASLQSGKRILIEHPFGIILAFVVFAVTLIMSFFIVRKFE